MIVDRAAAIGGAQFTGIEKMVGVHPASPETTRRAVVEYATVADAFVERLRACGAYPLKAMGVDTLQMNITRLCNLTCRHCHVRGGPGRTGEAMSRETIIQCIRAASHAGVSSVDITGGAPELHPDIEWLVAEMFALGRRLLVRSNLVALLQPERRHLMEVFAASGVELIGSLPDYRAERSDRQRGDGSFNRAIEAVRELNTVGYGVAGSGLKLDLVHNPAGAYLPAAQAAIEYEYRRVLRDEHNVMFSSLFSMVNCPAGRFLDYLQESGNLAEYMQALQAAFSPGTALRVMCRTTLSVGPDGTLYDCDFNQALGITIDSGAPIHIRDFDFDRHASREVRVRSHCFACTAGQGSSCQGALMN